MSQIRDNDPLGPPAPPMRHALPRDDAISAPSNQWADFQAARERFFAALRGESSAVVGVRRAGVGEGP